MRYFIELLTTTNYDICNRLIFGVLARYPKLMYSNFDYYNYKGNFALPHFHHKKLWKVSNCFDKARILAENCDETRNFTEAI